MALFHECPPPLLQDLGRGAVGSLSLLAWSLELLESAPHPPEVYINVRRVGAGRPGYSVGERTAADAGRPTCRLRPFGRAVAPRPPPAGERIEIARARFWFGPSRRLAGPVTNSFPKVERSTSQVLPFIQTFSILTSKWRYPISGSHKRIVANAHWPQLDIFN